MLHEEDLKNIKTDMAGIFKRIVNPGEEVHRGDILASIIDPLEGEVLSHILSPTGGIIFFAHNEPTVMEEEIVFKIIRRLHE